MIRGEGVTSAVALVHQASPQDPDEERRGRRLTPAGFAAGQGDESEPFARDVLIQNQYR
jgi:hypothetical protein